jgi:hypothetical protein
MVGMRVWAGEIEQSFDQLGKDISGQVLEFPAHLNRDVSSMKNRQVKGLKKQVLVNLNYIASNILLAAGYSRERSSGRDKMFELYRKDLAGETT